MAHVAWPSMRSAATGWSGTAFESASSVGNFCDGHCVWFQPRARIHVPGGVVFARSAMRATHSASSRAPRRFTAPSSMPRPAT